MINKNFQKIINILKKEPKLIEIQNANKIIFVGDTHGDLTASQKIIKEYLTPGNKIVFLGDYVDRGKFSEKNINFLLSQKLNHPHQIYLLQGNHEGYPILKFSPADFWEGLSESKYKIYKNIFLNLPLVATTKNIIALHGALPDVETLHKINKIKPGDKNWFQITWGDFREKNGEFLGYNPFSGRPEFGKKWFDKLMKRFQKTFLIRSHQTDCPLYMFNSKCLTIFTSFAYSKPRIIIIIDLKKEITSLSHFQIKILDK